MQGKTNKILEESLWANINKKKKSGFFKDLLAKYNLKSL